jgi:hypothetical protein
MEALRGPKIPSSSSIFILCSWLLASLLSVASVSYTVQDP